MRSLPTPTFFGGPLETSDDRVLDLVKILDSLGGVDEEIWSGSFGSEAPDLMGFVHVVLVFVAEVTATDLEILLICQVMSGVIRGIRLVF